MTQRLRIEGIRDKNNVWEMMSKDERWRQCMIEEARIYEKNKLYIKNTIFYQKYNDWS